MLSSFQFAVVVGLGVGLFSAQLSAQSADLRPLPVLNQDGSKPQGAEGASVFLDPNTGDIVATYRSSATEPVSLENQVRVLIQLSRHIRPRVLTVISYDEEAKRFLYSYTLRNDVPARQAAWQWFFESVDESSVDTVRVPPGWQFRFPVRSVGGMPIPERAKAVHIAFRAMQFFSVNAAGGVRPEQGIRSGEGMGGFHIRSPKRPGLVTVWAQGNASIPAYPDEPPESVTSQVDNVLRSAYNYQRTFAFAPKYETDAERTAVARGLLEDLRVLTSADEVDPRGEFAAAATTILQRMIKSEDVSPVEIIKLERQGRTGMDREFATAVCWALYDSRTCAR
jgi:hypothetical protein